MTNDEVLPSGDPSGVAPMQASHRPDPGLGWLEQLRSRTPARVFAGRTGGSYRTNTLLELRRDQAAARDAVLSEVDPVEHWGRRFVDDWEFLHLSTRASSKHEYLMRPDLGRTLSADSLELLQGERASQDGPLDLLIAVGDGLSAAAVIEQVPLVLPPLVAAARAAGWRVGKPCFLRYCRVGVLNDLGQALGPLVAVLLIGERPGLASADSLSAYLAYRPRPGDTDARRNLISNIHSRGVKPSEAVDRILRFIDQLRTRGQSGVAVKEEAPVATQSRLSTTQRDRLS